MSFPEPGACYPDEPGVCCQLAEVRRADIAHAGAQPAHQLKDVVGQRALVGDLALDALRHDLPAARLAVVEGLSTHIVEWVTTGRIDIGLVYNPEAQAGLEITPLLQEPLGLVSRAPKGKKKPAAPPLPMKELPRYPLIVPERVHAMRRLLETQAALAGMKHLNRLEQVLARLEWDDAQIAPLARITAFLRSQGAAARRPPRSFARCRRHGSVRADPRQ